MPTSYVPSHALDVATRLTGESGRWTASIDPTWYLLIDVPHGGATAALLLNAARELDPDRKVRTFTAQMMAPLLGEITVAADHVRETRSLSAVNVTASVGGKVAATASVVMGGQSESMQRRDFATPPVVPAVGDCPDIIAMAGEMFPRFIREHVDYRPALGVPFSGGDHPELAGWVRARQPREFDDLMVAVLLDTLPSSISVAVTGFNVAPTVEYSIAFDQDAIAAVAPDEWLLCHARNWSAGDGWSFEDAELYTAHGVLLAKARQLRRLGF